MVRRIDKDPARREMTAVHEPRMDRGDYDRLPDRARELLHLYAGVGTPMAGYSNPLAAPVEFTLPEYRVDRIERIIEEEDR